MSSTKNPKRKIIYLWTYTNWGGAQLYLLTIMKLAKDTWDPVVVLPRSSKKDLLGFYEKFDINCDFLENKFDPKRERTFSGKLRRQYERIRSEIEVYRYLRRYDLKESILHIEIAPWQSWILLTLLSLRRANVFITLNNFRPEASVWRRVVWSFRFWVISKLPGLHIFASNKDAKDSLKEWLTTRCFETVRIAYSPIDPAQIGAVRSADLDIPGLRKQHCIDADEFVVLAVGQFIDRKGRWTFLEAAKMITETTANVRFVWLMPESISAEDKIRVDSYGVGKRFVPVLSSDLGTDRESILGFFRIADAFALPSFIEGLPISLLEAMALGLPCISTNVYAIPEAIIPDQTGILIEAGDSIALATSIMKLKGDPNLRERLSLSGSRFALEHFDGRIMADRYLESYQQCFE